MTTPYPHQLSNLKTAKLAGVNAPHKPLLLLSVIDLIASGFIVCNRIELSEVLVRCFEDNWGRYVGVSDLFKPVVGTPFWHLHNEPFWRLVAHNGAEVTKDSVDGAKYSVNALRTVVAYAEIDKELF